MLYSNFGSRTQSNSTLPHANMGPFKQQKASIPRLDHQIPAKEKFEDRPMSPVFKLLSSIGQLMV